MAEGLGLLTSARSEPQRLGWACSGRRHSSGLQGMPGQSRCLAQWLRCRLGCLSAWFDFLCFQFGFLLMCTLGGSR